MLEDVEEIKDDVAPTPRSSKKSMFSSKKKDTSGEHLSRCASLSYGVYEWIQHDTHARSPINTRLQHVDVPLIRHSSPRCTVTADFEIVGLKRGLTFRCQDVEERQTWVTKLRELVDVAKKTAVEGDVLTQEQEMVWLAVHMRKITRFGDPATAVFSRSLHVACAHRC